MQHRFSGKDRFSGRDRLIIVEILPIRRRQKQDLAQTEAETLSIKFVIDPRRRTERQLIRIVDPIQAGKTVLPEQTVIIILQPCGVILPDLALITVWNIQILICGSSVCNDD